MGRWDIDDDMRLLDRASTNTVERTTPRDRIWIAYVDAERTLQGFGTFLDQYRVRRHLCGAERLARSDPTRVYESAHIP
jgi:hypothetical protein